MEDKKKIIIGFLRLQEPGCWDSGQFDRVEIKFSDGYTSFVDNERVQYVQRETDYYRSSFQIHVDVQIADEMQAYAHSCWQQKIQFNRLGEFWNFMPILNMLPVENKGKSFFGAEYICTILQKNYFFPELLAATTSPDKLYDALVYDPRAEIIEIE